MGGYQTLTKVFGRQKMIMVRSEIKPHVAGTVFEITDSQRSVISPEKAHCFTSRCTMPLGDEINQYIEAYL